MLDVRLPVPPSRRPYDLSLCSCHERTAATDKSPRPLARSRRRLCKAAGTAPRPGTVTGTTRSMRCRRPPLAAPAAVPERVFAELRRLQLGWCRPVICRPLAATAGGLPVLRGGTRQQRKDRSAAIDSLRPSTACFRAPRAGAMASSREFARQRPVRLGPGGCQNADRARPALWYLSHQSGCFHSPPRRSHRHAELHGA
jgi:hypothetical protein